MVYLLPQEVEVWYIIPALRKELSKLLVTKHKLSYEKAGEIIGVTKAAVSQYLSNKRATKLKLPEFMKKELENSAQIMSKDTSRAVKEMQRLLKVMNSKKCECDVCKKFNPGVFPYCECSDCQTPEKGGLK